MCSERLTRTVTRSWISASSWRPSTCLRKPDPQSSSSGPSRCTTWTEAARLPWTSAAKWLRWPPFSHHLYSCCPCQVASVIFHHSQLCVLCSRFKRKESGRSYNHHGSSRNAVQCCQTVHNMQRQVFEVTTWCFALCSWTDWNTKEKSSRSFMSHEKQVENLWTVLFSLHAVVSVYCTTKTLQR